MKKIVLALLFPASLMMIGCPEPKDETEALSENQRRDPALKGTIQVDISEYGLPLMITIPDTMNSPLNIVVQDWGETEIRVGKNFQIKIAEGGDMELRKSDLADDLLYTQVNYTVEESDVIQYSQGKSDDEHFKPKHHFYMVKSINGITYEIQDIVGEIDFSPSAITKMLNASKALEASAKIS